MSRIFKVVAFDNGYRKPITWRIWCDVPIRKGKYHLSTVHYKTREAAEERVLRYIQQFQVA